MGKREKYQGRKEEQGDEDLVRSGRSARPRDRLPETNWRDAVRLTRSQHLPASESKGRKRQSVTPALLPASYHSV